MSDNRASSPALLQHSWTPSYSCTMPPMSSPQSGSGTYPPHLATSRSGPITYAPPMEEQPRGLRQSVSARSTQSLRHASPMPAPSRSPQRTIPAAAWPPTRRFHTPVRARSPTRQAATPTAKGTPRLVCHTVVTEGAPGTPTSVKKVWAWDQGCATVATVQAAPTAQITSAAIHCTPATSCRVRSPDEEKARDPLQPSIRIMSLPTPMRKHFGSPLQTGRTTLMHATPTATTVAASTSFGSARVPVAGPTASPRESPVGTPKAHKVPAPPLFRASTSSTTLDCGLAERLKQAHAAQAAAMDWRSNPKVGSIGPSRCSSPPPLPA